ncbi:MAG TPA: hypothetical protein VF550_19760 [Polyangia bacterium]
MELTTLFLLVLLPPADATGDTASAVTASLRRELGDVAMAIAPDTLVTPAMWQGEKAQMRARFIVHLVWKDKDKAGIEVFAPTSIKDPVGFRRSRVLAFSPQDGKAERGRAIGLVVAELLRESPASSLIPAASAVDRSTAAGSPSHVVLGGMLAAERVRAGNWAMGPELTYDFGLSEALRLQASGSALFGSADQYTGIGAAVGIFWDFLHSERGRQALGIGLEVGALRESATMGSGDHGGSTSKWNVVLGPSLAGRLTVWRSLRIVGAFGLRLSSGEMTLTVGDDTKTTYTFSRWRPVGALGLEVAL